MGDNHHKRMFRVILSINWIFYLMICLLFPQQSFSLGPPKKDRQMVHKWFALGSGCKGNSEGEGDIKLVKKSFDKMKMRWRLDFQMQSYSLDGNQPINKDRPSFARECALRIAFYPKENLKIKDIRAVYSYHIKKDKGSKVEIYSKLTTGPKMLAMWHKEYSTDHKYSGQFQKVDMNPNVLGKKVIDAIQCSQPKIIGLDLTLLNRRDNFQPSVNVQFKDKRDLSLFIEMQSC